MSTIGKGCAGGAKVPSIDGEQCGRVTERCAAPEEREGRSQ
jgi:hypothetical protein